MGQYIRYLVSKCAEFNFKQIYIYGKTKIRLNVANKLYNVPSTSIDKKLCYSFNFKITQRYSVFLTVLT